MGKLFIRIDDRLIHGQIVTAWCQTLSIQQIIAVDDELANNPTLQGIMTMGVPTQYNTQIIKVDEVEDQLEKARDKNCLLIMRFCSLLGPLRELIKGADSINLGNCSKLPDVKYKLARGAGWFIYLSQADADILRCIAEEDGIEVVSQQLPQEKKIDWATMKKKMKMK